MNIKINNVRGFVKGSTVTISDNKGVPLDVFWRRRLADAKIDNCIEVLTAPKPKSNRTVKNDNHNSTT